MKKEVECPVLGTRTLKKLEITPFETAHAVLVVHRSTKVIDPVDHSEHWVKLGIEVPCYTEEVVDKFIETGNLLDKFVRAEVKRIKNRSGNGHCGN
jgi:hypothetical protein